MKVATAAFPLDRHDDWASYTSKISSWVVEAKSNGAELLVFPEYALMELASLEPEAKDMHTQARVVAGMYDAAEALFADLAKANDVFILLGSGPAWRGHDLVNRTALISRSGISVQQDKQIMTRFERDPWGICRGGPLKVFDTPLGRIGVLICYDGEFPLLGRKLVEEGVDFILLPSCTEELSGYWRVRIGAISRALEGQCVTVMSSIVGQAPWCEAISSGTGAGGVFGPPDTGFPATGVIAVGELNVPSWTYAEIDLEAIRNVRADGRVLNRLHWAEQSNAVENVETCRLH